MRHEVDASDARELDEVALELLNGVDELRNAAVLAQTPTLQVRA